MGLIKETKGASKTKESQSNGYYMAAIILGIVTAYIHAYFQSDVYGAAFSPYCLIFAAAACICCLIAENKAPYLGKAAIILFLFAAFPLTLSSILLILPIIPLLIGGRNSKHEPNE